MTEPPVIVTAGVTLPPIPSVIWMPKFPEFGDAKRYACTTA
jgi:hypothetical protein